ncbi:MAG TPA: CocE/NonD family hydrolase, partial [Capillimicrobium sp.]
YGYLTTRDGTKLAINVQLPGPASEGPYPTLVEYAGYGYANPAGPESGIAAVGNALGYAVVDVNMRGTGCSGGAFDYYETLQGLDGYDIVETVARQPWVAHDHVGMMGISYGGISQIYVAATQPPSLAAITPLSVIDETSTTLAPGGILNTGFALPWARDRADDAAPVTATSGQAWAWKRIQEGDATCKANQVLHASAVERLEDIERNRYTTDRIVDPPSPYDLAPQVEVPTYLACQWTDEQTGGHCPTLAERFTGTDKAWFTFTNGVHVDSLDPASFNRWYDFLEIYVAKRAPNLPQGTKDLAPVLFKAFTGVEGVTIPDDPIQGRATLAEAQAAFEALPPVRILFDNGAGAAPGVPQPGFERSFARWPIPGARNQEWKLADGSFRWDPKARTATNFSADTGSGDLWTAAPSYRWTQNPEGTALSSVSEPLAQDTTVIGTGEVRLRTAARARTIDLQATVTEVRPDGNESFVQSGWLRASPGRRVIPLYYQGHVYRAGSRIRVILSAPGGDQPVWAFADTLPRRGTPQVRVRGATLALPVVPGGAPTPLPPCPGLRGEPCRPFAPS